MLRIGSLFSGYGGLDIAVEQVLGARPVWFVENNQAASRVLAHHWPGVPNHGDVTRVDWCLVEAIEVLTGGFPCQDVSESGQRRGLIRRGGDATRSGLWAHMADAIDQLCPKLVIAENVRGLLHAKADSQVEPCPWCVDHIDDEHRLRALGAVLADLADLGYDAAWHGLRAADVGAPHGRFRVFIAAWPAADPSCLSWGLDERDNRAVAANAEGDRREDLLTRGRETAAAGAAGIATAAADSGRLDDFGRQSATGQARGGWAHGAVDRRGGAPAANAAGDRRDEGRGHPHRSGAGARGLRTGHVVGADPDGVRWGAYEPAIRRWEHVLSRLAPAPTEPGRHGRPRLAPRFAEWMQGLDEGHVAAVPGLSRSDQLTMLGNGIVPLQAATAVPILLEMGRRTLGVAA